MSRITLLTGGGRSGKSRHALELAAAYSHRGFIATMEAIDDETKVRIQRHQDERGSEWRTVESPLDVADALLSLSAESDVVVIDCLTVWLGNLMHHRGRNTLDAPEIAALVDALRQVTCDVILVTNEVGLGIIPANAMGRQFRDLAGGVNQIMARNSDHVLLMVSGYPMVVKETK
jgi:adenosylcobinamide kinase / adenosylcobinamide-phosphate guanylyltransferase